MNSRLEGGRNFIQVSPAELQGLDPDSRKDRLKAEYPWGEHPTRPGVSIPLRPDANGDAFGEQSHPAAWAQDFGRQARLAAVQGNFDALSN